MFCLLAVAGCAGPNAGPQVPRGAAAYEIVPIPSTKDTDPAYAIGPLDTLNISVFQEPDLSQLGVVVDASGAIDLPLIGRIQAAGRDASQLARQLERQWARYYVRPQVSVVVVTAVSQRVTVQGQVDTPGIYPIKGRTTLLDAIALAQGETRTAALNEVMVFRIVDGQRLAALFNVARIRRGVDPDPAIIGNDTVVVGYSNRRGLWQDILQAAPLLNVFRRY